MTTSMEHSSPEVELFLQVIDRCAAVEVPMNQLLDAAAEEQAAGNAGVFIEIEPDEQGPGARIDVRRETVDFKMGGIGPYVLSLDAVRELLAPPATET